ncbi:dTDP-4-amino-4,6-dideoxygalactose transaminase [Segeticoccus rhizosphaerae]|jgi:dTDP-4-amino-4,6-dideoxygalactose transaminase|uniref:dTDP-4-amino-4,6-dideoxygalactose transaminase n=1 Tax=Segeticoccus rhizosphaerae TaxID=1104777 RepID=UPI001939F398|nr:dTDP-4-amino-4,6-dideoxygalactose transaminase [Segeticoccus rhizosphaerae]
MDETSRENPAGAMEPIPFNRTAVVGRELDYIQESIERGHTSSGGTFSARAGQILAEETGAEEVLLTTSCTSALELSALMLDLGPTDTVIVPSFTFTSSALAFARQGARLLFCDIEPQTLGPDPEHLESLLDETVRALVIVHYAGIACDVDGIRKALARWPDVVLIEDNAHGLLGTWGGAPLGSLGRFATLSFHETKNFTCGEGGALLLNEASDIDRARVLYDKGTNRQAFMLGQVDKYSWKDTGGSFGLSDTLAAYLTAQLEQRDHIQSRRRAVFETYERALAPFADDLGFQLAEIPPDRGSAYHMFYVLLRDRETRNMVLQSMRAAGVNPTFHYVPLHSSLGGRRFAARPTECPVSEQISGRLLRLPFFNDLSSEDVTRVASAFLNAVSRGDMPS